jgi:hypothetical protein
MTKRPFFIPSKQKLTPLQKISLVNRGDAATTIEDELNAGLIAFQSIHSRGSILLRRLLSTYTGLMTQLQIMKAGSERLKRSKEFRVVKSKLFKQAANERLFQEVSVAVAALTQSVQYLMQSPDGEYANTAKQVITQIDVGTANLGAPTSNFNYSLSNPIFKIAFVLFTLKLLAGRSPT